MIELEDIKIKLSAKTGTAGPSKKVWGIGIPARLISRNTDLRRVRMAVKDGSLVIQLSADNGILLNRPSTKNVYYWTAMGQRHCEGISLPYTGVAAAAVIATYDPNQNTITVLPENQPPIVRHAIKTYNDLAEEVKSHIPPHSPEEFVEETRHAPSIGDREALRAVFEGFEAPTDPIQGQNPADANVWTDSEVTALRERLSAMMAARPDISVTLDLNGEIKLLKTVKQEL